MTTAVRTGPGLLVAATGVGAGGLVAATVAGASFGTVLLWAVLAGTAAKLALGEAVGRWHLASGTTLFDGWRRLGRWATASAGLYLVVWGAGYGAGLASAAGLPLAALVGGPDAHPWGAAAGVLALLVVVLGRYGAVRWVVGGLVVVTLAAVAVVLVLAAPDAAALLSGLVPRVPSGAGGYVLGLAGGAGGTLTLAAYGYWLDAHGTRRTAAMRRDNAVAYAVTAVLLAGLLVAGATVLLGTAVTGSGRTLLLLADRLGQQHGGGARAVALVGILAATTAALVGVWHGASLLVADWVRTVRLPHGRRADTAGTGDTAGDGPVDPGERIRAAERSWAFRGFPVLLAVAAAVPGPVDLPSSVALLRDALGGAFVPFLAVTLMLLLNSRHTAPGSRSGPLSNVLLGAAAVLSAALLITDVGSRLP